MKTLIKNAIFLTMEPGEKTPMQGSMVFEDEKISWVGKEEPADDNYDRIINGQDKLVMPGFVNTHGHAAMTLLRSFADDLPLLEWLEKKIWPAEAKLTDKDVYFGTLLAITEMLKSGTTTFADMYFFMDEAARAVEETGIRAVLSRGMVGVGDQSRQAVKESRQLVKGWHKSAGGRITCTLGPHAPYTCPPDYLKEVMELAAELNVPLQIHAAETAGEVEDSIKLYGKTPIEQLADAGMFDFPVLAAHCVYLTDNDLQILAEKDVKVAHCPGSNLKLGSGIAPVPKMLQAGITVGLGTDGAASNNNLDMLEEVRLAALLHKGANADPTLLPAVEALAMATREGAKALFLEDTGMLAPGMKADMVIVDLRRPHLTPRHDLIAHMVYAAQPSDIEMVFAAGKQLVDKGRCLAIDEERLMYECEVRATILLGEKGSNE